MYYVTILYNGIGSQIYHTPATFIKVSQENEFCDDWKPTYVDPGEYTIDDIKTLLDEMGGTLLFESRKWCHKNGLDNCNEPNDEVLKVDILTTDEGEQVDIDGRLVSVEDSNFMMKHGYLDA